MNIDKASLPLVRLPLVITDTSAALAPGAIRHALGRLASGADLDEIEAAAAFAEVMAGNADEESVSGLLMALRTKGEVAAEVAGAARALRGAMVRVAHPAPDRLVDTCGTGGGSVVTLNISTAAAFVAAGAGVPVAKHGNRSFTSRSGSADVLEALGVDINLTPGRAAQVLDEVGIVFLFAPTYHPAMRHVAQVRRDLGVTTIMNLIGPLANPAGATRQVLGVSDAYRGPQLADALARLGATRALVVHGMIGIDEIAPVGETIVWDVRDGVVVESRLDPTTVGLAATSLDGLAGGEPADNAAAIDALLRRPGDAPPALRSAVLLNAAAAVLVGLDVAMDEAVARATASLHDGHAATRLDALRRASAFSTSE